MSLSVFLTDNRIKPALLLNSSIGPREICSLAKTCHPIREAITKDRCLLEILFGEHFPTAPRSQDQSAKARWTAYKLAALVAFNIKNGRYRLASLALSNCPFLRATLLSQGRVAISFLATKDPKDDPSCHMELVIWTPIREDTPPTKKILGTSISDGPHELSNGKLVYLSGCRSSDGNFYAGGNRAIMEIWHPQTGEHTSFPLRDLKTTEAPPVELADDSPLVALADRNSIVSCIGDEISIWNLGTGAPTKSSLPSPEEGDPCVCQFAALYPNNAGSAAPSQSQIAVSYRDRTFRVWDPQERTCVAQMQSDQEICSWTAVPNGRIAIGRADHTIQIWDPIRNRSTFLRGYTEPVTEIRAISDRYIVPLYAPRACGGYQGAAPIPVSAGTAFRAWDTETGEPCTSFLQTELDHDSSRLLPNGEIVTLAADQHLHIRTPSNPEGTAPRLVCPELLRRYSALISSGSQLPDGKIIAQRCENLSDKLIVFDWIDYAVDNPIVCVHIADLLTSPSPATQASGEARLARLPAHMQHEIAKITGPLKPPQS